MFWNVCILEAGEFEKKKWRGDSGCHRWSCRLLLKMKTKVTRVSMESHPGPGGPGGLWSCCRAVMVGGNVRPWALRGEGGLAGPVKAKGAVYERQ